MKERKILIGIIILVSLIVLFSLILTAKVTGTPPNADRTNLEKHRKAASGFISSLYKAAKIVPEHADELKKIAQEQNQSEVVIVTAMEEIENRGKYWQMIVGSDYKGANQIRAEIGKTAGRLRKLEIIAENTENQDVKIIIEKQIGVMRKEIQKLENFTAFHQKKFSLLGWFLRLFY